MKVCPQCDTEYADDYVFCLNDGNTLTDESGEQETLFKNKFVFSDKSASMPSEMSVKCLACGLENRAASKFCKKCGGHLARACVDARPTIPAEAQSFGFVRPRGTQNFDYGEIKYDEPAAYQSHVFVPPATTGQPFAGSGKKQTSILIAAAAAGLLLIVGAVIYSSQSGSSTHGSVSARSNANQAVPHTSSPARNASSPIANVAPSAIGRKGHLITNQRIRSDSNRYAEILGVHYQGAKVDLLDEKNYTTDDGPVTWYRVRVFENGCDREGTLGCGNDLNGMSGQAAMEGWMNAKYIALD